MTIVCLPQSSTLDIKSLRIWLDQVGREGLSTEVVQSWFKSKDWGLGAVFSKSWWFFLGPLLCWEACSLYPCPGGPCNTPYGAAGTYVGKSWSYHPHAHTCVVALFRCIGCHCPMSHWILLQIVERKPLYWLNKRLCFIGRCGKSGFLGSQFSGSGAAPTKGPPLYTHTTTINIPLLLQLSRATPRNSGLYDRAVVPQQIEWDVRRECLACYGCPF